MTKMSADIRSLCRAYTPETVRIVAGIVRAESTPPGERLRGIAMLWERGWGKAPQVHAGADGEGALQVTIRHIIEGRDGLPIDRARDTIATHAKLINGNNELDDSGG